MNQPQQQTPPEAWTERTRLLFGDDRVSELTQCHVLIVGLGGVGGFAAELIARAGIGRMTIVDADIVQPSNINRQLVATTDALAEGESQRPGGTPSRHQPPHPAGGHRGLPQG